MELTERQVADRGDPAEVQDMVALYLSGRSDAEIGRYFRRCVDKIVMRADAEPNSIEIPDLEYVPQRAGSAA